MRRGRTWPRCGRALGAIEIGLWDVRGRVAAYLHLSAALEPIREPSQTLFRWLADDVIAEPFVPRDGKVTVSPGPGLGLELDPQAFERCRRRFIEEGPFPSGGKTSHYGADFQRI
jgi:glucarate dehydratase